MALNIESIAVLAELQTYGIPWEFAGGDEVKVKCPFHKDGKENSPSCHINTQKRLFKCQTAGCEQSGDIITLLARSKNENRALIIKELSTRYDLDNDKAVDPVTVERWHDAIWKADALRNELYRRGVTDKMIRKHRFGYDDNTQRITIPIKSKSGNFVNVRKYLPGAPGKMKMRNLQGFGSKPQWFPVEQLKYDKIMLCGGECKALVAAEELNKHDIGAISGTWGEGNLPPELLQDLKGKHVYVCMDIDEAGCKAAIKHATALRLYGIWSSIIQLPLDTNLFPKGDINDYVVGGAKLEPLIQLAIEFIPNYVEKLVDDCSEPAEFELAAAIHADHSGKRIRVKAVVSHLDQTPYLVPKDVVIKCDKDQSFCALCPISVKGRNEFTIPKESSTIIEFVDAPTTHHLEVIKSAVGIPKPCRVCEFVKLSEYNVEDSRLAPSLELTNVTGDRQPIPALCIGRGLALNEAYYFTGKLVAHPKTQQATLLISSYEAAQDALSSYTVDSAQHLSTFWPEECTVDSIEKKFTEIYSDLSFNVTNVWGRQSLHLAVDLTYHCPLLINFDGQDEHGWINLLVIGDSSNGKSQCTMAMSEHYQLGKRFDCSNSTVAGLLGGLEKVGDKWFMTWGAIPQNDRRLVIIEEVKEAPEEAIAKLRDMRSSGVAQTVKIGGGRKANARTRQIWISNPRSDCKIASYPYGIDAIRELIGAMQDIRRFDVALITTEGDVDSGLLNRTKASREPVPHKYTSDICRQLILWNWTRTREQVIYTPDAEQVCLQEAEKLCSTFSDAIPIVDRGSMRYKLARLAAGVAGRLFSCSEDFNSLVINWPHVQYAANWLHGIYSAPTFGYHTFSKAQQILSTLLEPDVLRAAILSTPYPKDLCRTLLATQYIEQYDMCDWTTCDRGQAASMISLLVRKHALVRKHNYYYKTPPFIELLKEIETDPSVSDSKKVDSEQRF